MRRLIRAALVTVVAALGCMLGASAARAADNNLAPTPPMGWNSFNAYACDNNAQAMEQVAKFIHTSGLEREIGRASCRERV